MTSTAMARGLLFDAPTQNTDGSAVTAGEITKFQVGLGTSSGAASGTYPTVLDDVDLSPDPTTGKQIVPISAFSALQKGVDYFAAVRAVSAGGNSSWSSEVTFHLAQPITNPPAGLQIV